MGPITEDQLIQFFKTKIAEELRIPLDEIDPTIEFINFGMDSVNSIFVLQHLEKITGIELNPLLFWEYPTIESFSRYLAGEITQNSAKP